MSTATTARQCSGSHVGRGTTPTLAATCRTASLAGATGEQGGAASGSCCSGTGGRNLSAVISGVTSADMSVSSRQPSSLLWQPSECPTPAAALRPDPFAPSPSLSSICTVSSAPTKLPKSSLSSAATSPATAVAAALALCGYCSSPQHTAASEAPRARRMTSVPEWRDGRGTAMCDGCNEGTGWGGARP